MMGRTHLAFGGAVYLGAVHFLGAPLDAVAAGAVLLGSLAPDMDHPKSVFGRWVPFLSYPLSWIAGHRGVTHSGAALLACLAAAAFARLSGEGRALSSPLLWFALGWASHLVADAGSNYGIPLRWPEKRRWRLPVTVSTGGAAEYLFVFLPLAGLCALLLLSLLGSGA